jgi:hypothetical protein
MFEITEHENPATHLYTYVIDADFVIPVKSFNYSPYESEIPKDITFKQEHFQFKYKLAISYEMAFEMNVSSVIGRQLRGEFVGQFGQMKSQDALERALYYMASCMNDDGFRCGLLYGGILLTNDNPSDKKAQYEYKEQMLGKINTPYNTGGIITPGLKTVPPHARETKFSQKASSFSNKAIFHQNVRHPVNKADGWPLRKVIMDLNDNHGWTREAIADWLETLDININMQPKEEANV